MLTDFPKDHCYQTRNHSPRFLHHLRHHYPCFHLRPRHLHFLSLLLLPLYSVHLLRLFRLPERRNCRHFNGDELAVILNNKACCFRRPSTDQKSQRIDSGLLMLMTGQGVVLTLGGVSRRGG